jgi:indolepyruvate ferredoxin oxidoreductase beta subunit
MKSSKPFNLLIVGVGGQGVIRSVQILSHAAALEGFHVRTAETHGMAQRGGSVSSYLRFGLQVEGPLIPRGMADVILAFEASEAIRNFNYAGQNTIFFVNDELIIPPMIHQMGFKYPDTRVIHEFLKNVSPNIYFINANELALKAGNIRTLNVVILGVLSGSGKIPLTTTNIESAIMLFVPLKAKDVNHRAFEIGIEYGKSLTRYNNE